MKKILLMALIVFNVHGQVLSEDKVGVDIAQQDPYMSERYIKGPYLMYDCVGGYWVCSGKEEFKRCSSERERAKVLKVENLGCAPIRGFPSHKSCVMKQLEMVSRGKWNQRFCIHPEARRSQVHY